jgi:hypothetical protein
MSSIKFLVKCKEKMLYVGNQINNFISSSGSGTVINYGSDSGSEVMGPVPLLLYSSSLVPDHN